MTESPDFIDPYTIKGGRLDLPPREWTCAARVRTHLSRRRLDVPFTVVDIATELGEDPGHVRGALDQLKRKCNLMRIVNSDHQTVYKIVAGKRIDPAITLRRGHRGDRYKGLPPKVSVAENKELEAAREILVRISDYLPQVVHSMQQVVRGRRGHEVLNPSIKTLERLVQYCTQFQRKN